MTTFIITLLAISQIVSFYLIIKRLKPKVIKPDGIVLKPLKKIATYEDVDPNHDLVYEVLETIKIDGWDLELEPDISSLTDRTSFRLVFTSKDYKTILRSRITKFSGEMRLGQFFIAGPKGGISIDDKSPIKNDLILFLWDYVVEYYEEKYKEDKVIFENTISGIRKSLTTLRRSERLNNILND